MKQELRQIGVSETNAPVLVDVGRFLEGRLLIASTSGGGKSTTARSFLEATHGACPQIIIDPEGEFSSLRDEFDGYVLAAPKGGDVLLNSRTAGLLASKTVQLNISIILDLYELEHGEKHLTVKNFIEGLLKAPKEFWGPRIVLLDEAHRYCPEKGAGSSPATGAVIQLMDSGRKRGLGTALASQRLSKLAKDAAAECWNKMIGPTAWDDDRMRAVQEMGMERKDKNIFRELDPGAFMLAGRAFSIGKKPLKDATKVMIAMPTTKTPKLGQRRAKKAATSAKVKAALAKLGDLPKQAQEEAKTIEECRDRIRTLEQDLRKAQAEADRPRIPIPEHLVPNPEKIRALAERIAKTEVVKLKGAILKEMATMSHMYFTTADEAGRFIKDKQADFEKNIRKLCDGLTVPPILQREPIAVVKIPDSLVPYRKLGDSVKIDRKAIPPIGGELPKPQAKIISFLLMFPTGKEFTNKQIGVMVGMSGTSGTFNNHVSALSTRGLIDRVPGGCRLKDKDAAALATGGSEPIRPIEARLAWLQKLGAGPAKVYKELLESPHKVFGNVEMAELVGSSISNGNTSGTFNNWLSELSTLGLALRGKGTIQLDPAVRDL